jgi:hypothetical protein
MKQLFTLALILGLFSQVFAQDIQYKQFFPLRMGSPPQIEGVEVKQTYRLSKNELILIGDVLEGHQDYGLHLFYFKRSDANADFKEVFRSKKAMGSLAVNPSFFRGSDLSYIIIASGDSKQKVWGEQLFLVQDEAVEEMGGLDITLTEEYQYHQISPNLKIVKEGDDIFFRISGNLMLMPNSDADKGTSQIEYIYKNGSLQLVE